MNILHLNTFDLRGGAARAAFRIHTALQKNNNKSEIFVAKKDSKNDTSIKKIDIHFLSKKKWITRKLEALTGNIAYSTFNLFDSGVHQKINQSNADIVHFHWIGNELISISEIKKITKPIVWTLHDMWAFCGAEHYDDINNPGIYRYGYKKKINLNAITWRRKKKYWQDIDFHFVSPSCWLADCLRESSLFKGRQAKVIRNCLNVNQYFPLKKWIAREKISIPFGGKIILFGADGKDTNQLKGFQLLKDAFRFIAGHDLQLVIFGGKKGECSQTINGLNVIETGKITDDDYLTALYSAADVFVIPSMIDNYPNTVLEAMSCGTPCVGFKVGGIPEMIDHQVNGYLVDPFDTKQLAEGILWVLSDKEKRDELGKNARCKIEKECNETKIAEEYKMLYDSILRDR
jgi:glycosyltransferase involved in cell wall biosynthesis